MARLVRNYDPRPVAEFTVAPHRYTWNRNETYPNDYKKFMATIPYREGDVVYIDRHPQALKARILDVFCSRDRFGDRREKYRIQIETKKGFWSKDWTYTYPGFIQRGYKKAGMAPDIPD